MNARVTTIVVGCLLTVAAGATSAQHVESADAVVSSGVLRQIPMFSYRDGVKSDLLFRNTPTGALAEGTARVEYEDGHASISAKVDKLPAPGSLGPYAVYVLWALTPNGRAVKEGVIAGFHGGKGKMTTRYDASEFALIITAEPHFAVASPSTMIVLYNVADDVKGQAIGVTTLTGTDYSSLPRLPFDRPNSPALVQARHAVAIARQADAEQFAGAAYSTAKGKLAEAEMALEGKRHAERKFAPILAREAVVAAEDARRAAVVASAASQSEADATERATAVATAWTELHDRLNTVLPTRATDRGLVANIGGVEFATGTASISPSARERVARFSRIVASYPDLRFNVEGHTDGAGSAAANKNLSLRRAIAVRDSLIGEGIPASSIDVAGIGASMPTADSSTAAEHARNRRVEIVVSGGPLAAN